jgi:hypothetical protein
MWTENGSHMFGKFPMVGTGSSPDYKFCLLRKLTEKLNVYIPEFGNFYL